VELETKIMSIFLLRNKVYIATCQAWCKRNAHYFYENFLKPKANGVEKNRKEGIVTTVIFTVLLVIIVFEIAIVVQHFSLGNEYRGISLMAFSLILLLFLSLYIAVRKGFSTYAANAFFFIFFCASSSQA
jgi:hypothetical protein